MATTDFKIFANGQGLVGYEELNIAPLGDEQLEAEMKTGFYSGMASSKRFNRVLRQATTGTATIADFVSSALSKDVKDEGISLVEQFKLALGASLYPVGSIYMSVNATNPSALFGGGWQALDEGRVLIGANSTYSAGSKGGEATHTLTASEMPAHAHTGTASSEGAHTHTRGSQNITGSHGGHAYKVGSPTGDPNGCFVGTSTGNGGAGKDGNVGVYRTDFDASQAWTGESSSAGAHTHAVSVGNTGGGAAHNNMPPYLSVYMWKRVA